MPVPSTIQQEDYANFLSEASDLLQTIEQELFNLKQDRTPARVHTLMRSAHTLKGSAASVQLETVKSIAHVLEDVFRALYNPAVVIDAEIESLLFQAYECLRLPLMAEFTGGSLDDAEILDRTTIVLSQLQDKLGDLFDQETPIPTSAELGFDIVQSMFENGVEQRLQALEHALTQPQLTTLATQLQTEVEVFLGLAESVQLAGFGAIAQTTLSALAACPDQVQQIASIAIADFRKGQAAVLAGDRTQGGMPSSALQQIASTSANVLAPAHTTDNGTNQSSAPRASAFLQQLKQIFALERLYHRDRSILPTPPASPTVTPSSPTFDHNLDALFDHIQAETIPALPPSTPLATPSSTAPFPNVALPVSASTDASELEPPTAQGSHPIPDLSDNPSPVSFPLPDLSATVNSASTAGTSSPMPVVRVRLEQLERLDYVAGELLINQNQQTTQDEQFRLATQELLLYLRKHKRTLSSLQNWADLPLATNGSLSQQLPPEIMASFDVLEMDRYTDFQMLLQSALNDLVQLEVVWESLETQFRQVRQSRETQKRLLTSLQDDLTTARMQPLGEILDRLPRALKQLSSIHNKPIEISLSGTSVLVDKAIAEKLYNPLLHLVRNAFDHGIESPTLRRDKGKSETGHIHIHAYHQGNRTFIEIRDDGQGIDWQRVAEKAIEIGLVSPDSATELSPSQLTDFLFRSGFSTTSQVSDLSGRGIGLDMVRSEMQALKGSVSVRSVAGQGTTFTLALPMSFSITRLMVCQHQGITYALPMNTIQQVVSPQPHQLIQTSGNQVVLKIYQDQVEKMIPVNSLSCLLNYPTTNTSQETTFQPNSIILIRSDNKLWGLCVDQVMGEQELVIRPLGSTITPPPYVYGCSILNDRQMALVIDPILLQKSRTTPFHPTPPDRTSLTLNSRPTTASLLLSHILLVEDSLTVRHSLARILQEQGYRVSESKDGLEAFAYLQQNPDIHLIISDIEMPRMNGFEFLSQLRKTPALQTIPVVLLTSRSGSKYRQFATNLGANAFINKPYSTETLLPILSTLIKSSGQVSSLP